MQFAKSVAMRCNAFTFDSRRGGSSLAASDVSENRSSAPFAFGLPQHSTACPTPRNAVRLVQVYCLETGWNGMETEALSFWKADGLLTAHSTLQLRGLLSVTIDTADSRQQTADRPTRRGLTDKRRERAEQHRPHPQRRAGPPWRVIVCVCVCVCGRRSVSEGCRRRKKKKKESHPAAFALRARNW